MWVPPSNYTFPLSLKNEKRKLRFQFKWLLEFNWLAYSEAKGGAFCKYCLIFVKVGGKNRQPLGNFVKTAFDAWKKAKQVVILFHLYLLVIKIKYVLHLGLS